MDNRNRKLDFKVFFRGTVNECSVHLRPITRHALEVNAAKLILVHNHPSGNCKPRLKPPARGSTGGLFAACSNRYGLYKEIATWIQN